MSETMTEEQRLSVAQRIARSNRKFRWQHGASTNGHCVMVCDPQSGHFYRSVAMCETDGHAKDIADAINAGDALSEALDDCMQWLSAFAQAQGGAIRIEVQASERYLRYVAALSKSRGEP